MRQALAASAPHAPPAQPHGGYMSQAERTKASLGTSRPQQPPQQASWQSPPPERRGMGRGVGFGGPGQNQNRDRFTPAVRKIGVNDRNNDYRPPPQNRYNVNMDARPQVNTPAFGAGHLRRRNEAQAERAQFGLDKRKPPHVSRAPSQRRVPDRDEISKLLGEASTRSEPPKPYTPFARDTNVGTAARRSI
jgi:translation initiation factor IF-2